MKAMVSSINTNGLELGKKKHVDLPDFVKSAREAARLIPDNVLAMAYLTRPNVAAGNFVAWELPNLSSEIISSKA